MKIQEDKKLSILYNNFISPYLVSIIMLAVLVFFFCWFVPSLPCSSDQLLTDCACPRGEGPSFGGLVTCLAHYSKDTGEYKLSAGIHYSTCLTLDHENNSTLVAGLCTEIGHNGLKLKKNVIFYLPDRIDQLEEQVCRQMRTNHTGTLCGSCQTDNLIVLLIMLILADILIFALRLDG